MQNKIKWDLWIKNSINDIQRIKTLPINIMCKDMLVYVTVGSYYTYYKVTKNLYYIIVKYIQTHTLYTKSIYM